MSTLKRNFSKTDEIDHPLSRYLHNKKSQAILKKIEDNTSSGKYYKLFSWLVSIYAWGILLIGYEQKANGLNKLFLITLLVTISITLFYSKKVSFDELINCRKRTLFFYFLFFIFTISFVNDIALIKGNWHIENFLKELPFFHNNFSFSKFSYIYLTVFYSAILAIVTTHSSYYEKYKAILSTAQKHSKSFLSIYFFNIIFLIITIFFAIYIIPYILNEKQNISYLPLLGFCFVYYILVWLFILIIQSSIYIGIYKFFKYFKEDSHDS